MEYFLTLESEAVRYNLINLKQIIFEVIGVKKPFLKPKNDGDDNDAIPV
jgi:hypothetical protein